MKSEYKTTLRLNLEKARDRKIYRKIADKKNINEYIKHCIESSEVNNCEKIEQIIKDTVKEVLLQLQSAERAESEDSFKKINVEAMPAPPEEKEDEERKEELSEAAFNFLESLGSI